jgi:hypothetical protein
MTRCIIKQKWTSHEHLLWWDWTIWTYMNRLNIWTILGLIQCTNMKTIYVNTKEKKDSSNFLPISSPHPLILNVNTFVMPRPPRLCLSNERQCARFMYWSNKSMCAFHDLCVSEIIEIGMLPTSQGLELEVYWPQLGLPKHFTERVHALC